MKCKEKNRLSIIIFAWFSFLYEINENLQNFDISIYFNIFFLYPLRFFLLSIKISKLEFWMWINNTFARFVHLYINLKKKKKRTRSIKFHERGKRAKVQNCKFIIFHLQRNNRIIHYIVLSYCFHIQFSIRKLVNYIA